ncbi:MAG: phosphatase PAP2 family protein [Acidimicrobiia bacterium]|nr:phosphatase PAP2 family protein [Acidimicrobiia bacterium]
MTQDARPTVAAVLERVVPFIGVALTLLALSLVLPFVNPYGSWPLDLTGSMAMVAYYLTLSGAGTFGPLTATLICVFLVLRPGIGFLRRIGEFVMIYGVVLVVIQAWVNIEPIAKDYFAQTRPVIWQLSTMPAGSPALGMDDKAFYRLPDRPATDRRDLLIKVLSDDFTAIPVAPIIRQHWTSMTDYGFPSGHAVGAMLNAFLFLTLGNYLLPVSWRWPMYVVFVWMIAICYSRPMLREHAPVQILGGGTIGILLGLIVFVAVSTLFGVIFGKSGGGGATRDVSAA